MILARNGEVVGPHILEINQLESEVAAARVENGYLHDLLTQQGAPLVAAVKKTLEFIGFGKVVDVDAENQGLSTADLNEDLRIEDQSPTLLVEVKGIGRWTAEMFLMFHELRADVLPVDDIGLQKAVAMHYFNGKRPTLGELRAFGEKWRPYRSTAAWYLWRALD